MVWPYKSEDEWVKRTSLQGGYLMGFYTVRWLSEGFSYSLTLFQPVFGVGSFTNFYDKSFLLWLLTLLLNINFLVSKALALSFTISLKGSRSMSFRFVIRQKIIQAKGQLIFATFIKLIFLLCISVFFFWWYRKPCLSFRR